MKISLNTDVELIQILNQVTTNEMVPIIKARVDKAEILESFSAQELAAYIVHNSLINEELVASLISDKKLNLELILGKVAITHFQKTINVATATTDPNK